MSLRDRGKLKWKPASFIPLAFEMTREMYRDQERMPKPLIDEDQREDFDRIICTAMEYSLTVKLTVWKDGYTTKLTGKIHYVDPIKEELRIEINPREFKRVLLRDVVMVKLAL